jgi:hypothetical protein
LAIFAALDLLVSSEEPWIGSEEVPNFDLQVGSVQWTTRTGALEIFVALHLLVSSEELPNNDLQVGSV